MTVTLFVTLVVVVLAAGLFVFRAIPGIRAFFGYRGKHLITCPETQKAAAVDVAAGEAAIGAFLSEPTLRLKECSRWPERQDCGLEPTGPVIGMLRKSSFHENVVSLAPGDLLVAYTDGLCETANSRGEEWGFGRLMATIHACSYRKARDIVDRVLETAEAFAGGCPQHDDMTLWLGRIEESNCGTLTLTDSVPLQAVD